MPKITQIFSDVKKAAPLVCQIEDHRVVSILEDLAKVVCEKKQFILAQNAKDLERLDPKDPKYDRLALNEARLMQIAADLKQVAALPSPLNRVLESRRLKNDLLLEKKSVPLGVIGIIYEARPNVTFDVFSLCFRSGNACLLKGGKYAQHSNIAIVRLIHEVLVRHKVSPQVVQLLPAERAVTERLLQASAYIDLLIPRGGKPLIDFVRTHARVPIIETGAGVVHTYFDETADLQMGKEIVLNAKTRRVSVCNALDCLLIHKSRLPALPALCEELSEKQVIIYADTPAYAALKNSYRPDCLKLAEPTHFGTEFLDYKMAVRTVNGLETALAHIETYGSKHSEAIISTNSAHIDTFFRRVDAAVVYANASTAFTDGAQFEMGAEIGISTQKMHARGPMGLRELTAYKWVVSGKGQVRS